MIVRAFSILRQLAVVAGVLLLSAGPAVAQTAEPDSPSSPPRLRRWVDVQHLQLGSRFRWVETSSGRLTSSTVQWQPQVRARLLADANGRFSVHVGAFGGRNFIGGWDNTAAGLGEENHDFHVKQLFVAARTAGVEMQVGSLYFDRGENTELISYDNDAYLDGERITVRRAQGRVSELAVTAGYFGDFTRPNAFARMNHMARWNYAHLLVGLRPLPRMVASVDYTREAGRDIFRQAATIRLPPGARVAQSLKMEAYERVGPDHAAGYNLAADSRFGRLVLTTGIVSVDRNYGPYNGDRFEIGRHAYQLGTVTLTRDFTVGWFIGEGLRTSFPIPNQHRIELLATFNPTQTLRRKGAI